MYERNDRSWHPLDQSGDPIPGNPGELESNAAILRSNAGNLGRAVDNLRRLRNADNTCSDTVTKIMTLADSTATTLDQVRVRYGTIADALDSYAPQLRAAQRKSLEALEAATSAVQRENEARRRAESAYWRHLSMDQGVRDQAQVEYHEASSDVNAAQATVAEAKALLARAIADRNRAGEEAECRIRAVVQDSPLNDTFLDQVQAVWETVSKPIADVAAWIWENLDTIATVLTIAAAFLPALAPLAAVVRTLTYVKMATALLQGINTGLKTGNWNAAVKAGLTIGLSLAAGGLGKMVGKLSSKVGTWATKMIDKRNLKLMTRIRDQLFKVYKGATLNDVGVKTMTNSIHSGLSVQPWHPGAAAAKSLFSAKNPEVRRFADVMTGITRVMKGSDYGAIKAPLEELARLGKESFVSAGTRDAISSFLQKQGGVLLSEAVATGTEKALQPLIDRIPSSPEPSKAQQSGSSASTCRVVAGGLR